MDTIGTMEGHLNLEEDNHAATLAAKTDRTSKV